MLGPLRQVGGGSGSVGPRNFQPRQYPEDVVYVFVLNTQVIDVVEPQGDIGIACLSHVRNDKKVDEVSLMNETAGGWRQACSHIPSVGDGCADCGCRPRVLGMNHGASKFT